MAQGKTRIINLYIKSSAVGSIFKRLRGDRSDYDFSDIGDLRKVLSNEKLKILNIITSYKPDSIYKLAKILKRDFKSVIEDIKLLNKFGFIELKPLTKGKRKMLKPEVLLSSLQININFQ